MKMLNGFSLLLFLAITACSPKVATFTKHTNQPINQTMLDKKGNTHLLGLSNRQGLQQDQFKEWFDKYYTAYQPQKAILDKHQAKLKDVEILVFMGTWCGDSKREVPRFYKILDALEFNEQQLTLVNLDSKSEAYKQSPEQLEKGLNIHRVPTFIIYKNGEEMGRIVESPVTNLETDLVQILNGLPTQPNYRVVTRLDIGFKNKELEDLNKDDLEKKWTNYIRRNAKSSSELNTYGYVLMSAERMEEALTVFKLNALAFPKEANVFDSLGEGYLKLGKRDLARKQFEKALAIEPTHKNAKKMLEELIDS